MVRALEHDNEHLLLTLALGHLRQHGILRPGIVELERLVGALAEWAQAETYRRLLFLLTPDVVTQFDALLVVDPALYLRRHYLAAPAPNQQLGDQYSAGAG